MKNIKALFVVFLFVCFSVANVLAQESKIGVADSASAKPATAAKFNPKDVIIEHVMDSHEWHFFSIGQKHISFPLPCILYSKANGVQFFSFAKIESGEEFEGYSINEKHKIVRADGVKFLDFSITKNVLSLLIAAALLLFIFLSIAKKYSTNKGKAPTGFQNAIEPIILFVKDEVALPMLKHKHEKYLPYLLTVFFFIWINNLMGMIPGSANFTGNIAVTACLAILTFILLLAGSKLAYWKHIIAMPGVPWPILIILTPVEIIGLVIKPLALMVRLFANILAGHMIILTIICLIFIFAAMNQYLGYGSTLVMIPFAIFIDAIELMVGFIQAYIFTTLTAMFISEAVLADDGHH